MAVQKSRVTPSRKGMRQSHDRLKAPAISTEPATDGTPDMQVVRQMPAACISIRTVSRVPPCSGAI